MSVQHADPREVVVRLHEEHASVTKRRSVTGRVRISTVTREREQMLNEIPEEKVGVDRILVGKLIEARNKDCKEGETTIIPVVEKILVVERRLLLKERVRHDSSNTNHRERVMLHCQEPMATRDPFEPLVAGWATERVVNTNQTQ